MSGLIDVTGRTFGRLTVVGKVASRGKGACWRCQCECGSEKVVLGAHLRSGYVRSCGCLRVVNMVGKVFGRLVVVARADNNNSGLTRWRCRCECGSESLVTGAHLRRGDTRSCGCLRSDSTIKTHTTHGESSSGVFKVWSNIIQRTSNPRNKRFHRYGGRGITMCERWRNSFEAFRDDMGPRPEGHLIERVDNDGNYEPGNCCWATMREQGRNTSTTILDIQKARQIRWLAWYTPLLHRVIGETYGVRKSTVGSIKHSRSWKEILQ